MTNGNCGEKYSGSSFLVTGGAGFIGSHIANALIRGGAGTVRIVDDLSYGSLDHPVHSSGGTEFVRFSLGSDADAELEDALKGIDFVFHCAALKLHQANENPGNLMRVNVDGTVQLLEACRRSGVKKIIFTSSLYAYGRMKGEPFKENEKALPRTFYGLTKKLGEEIFGFYGRRFEILFNAVRLMFVYGPYQFSGQGYPSVIVKNFGRLLRGELPVVFGDGRQVLDYIYVSDVVNALLTILFSDTTGEIFNVGSGMGVSVLDLTDKMCEAGGVSKEFAFGEADNTAGTCRVADISKIQRTLSWSPRVDLDKGLGETLLWLKKGHGNDK